MNSYQGNDGERPSRTIFPKRAANIGWKRICNKLALSLTYSYDNLDRISCASVLTSGGQPLTNAAQGSYSYDMALAAGHALSEITSAGIATYFAGYDAAGDMTCRALNIATCTSGPNTGQVLTCNPLRQLIAWQTNSGSMPETGAYASDGSGLNDVATDHLGTPVATLNLDKGMAQAQGKGLRWRTSAR